MTTPTFLFDLDMTLLDTSSLQHYRDYRQWDEVNKRFHLVKPFGDFETPPHILPNKLKARGYPVGIVTSSPRWYAETLLRTFNIHYDTLVAYGDTVDHKPDPAPLIQALENLGTCPQDAYHVGDSTQDVEASCRAGVVSIGVGWSIEDTVDALRMAPDIMIYNPGHLYDVAQISRLGYIAEVYANGVKGKIHRGSVMCWQNLKGGKHFAFGRYFPTQDKRHASSELSRDILCLKDSDASASIFADALKDFIEKSKKDFSTIVIRDIIDGLQTVCRELDI